MQLKPIAQIVIAMGAAALSLGSAAQTADNVLQLPKVVEKAVTTHPEVRARYQDFVSSLEGQNIARGGWRPQVTAQGWVGKEWRSHMPGQSNYDWNRPGWNLDLRQLIFDGGITSNNIKQWGFEKLSGYYELMATSNNLANEATAAYLDVQRYREMRSLARDNYSVHETTLKQLRERQQSGVGRGVDLEQANGRLALAQTNLMTESNNLNDVTQRYRRVVGEYPVAELEPVADVGAKLPASTGTVNFMDSLRTNPSLLSKQALVQAAQAGEKSAKGSRAPLVELRAGVGRDRSQPDGIYRDMQTAHVQVLMTYNLYRGGADEARVRQTAAQAYAARDVADYTCRNVQQELSISWNNIMRLRQQMPFLQEHEQSTAKVRLAYQQQFQIGQRTLLDLLNTENELFDARRALLNAQYDLKKAEYQWLALSDKLLATLGLTQPHTGDLPQ
ncbi:MAG: TolC family outer membrane protein, partial [Comamonas sp.]|uniref:TolC family outer membrane protein n=1 Tax=Comamonas sp. TaxID=34028 RepID=UPI0028295AAD